MQNYKTKLGLPNSLAEFAAQCKGAKTCNGKLFSDAAIKAIFHWLDNSAKAAFDWINEFASDRDLAPLQGKPINADFIKGFFDELENDEACDVFNCDRGGSESVADNCENNHFFAPSEKGYCVFLASHDFADDNRDAMRLWLGEKE